ncbi:MAG: FAD-dependent oxidoreductase [Raoultibacter sp.]|jgi:fumarate reductase flavoprotein subunit
MKSFDENLEEIQETESGQALSRRGFLKGGVAVGAAAALGGTALVGCSAGSASSSKSDTSNASASSDLPDAEPIPPADPPESWDDEAEVIVVGTGGGGLAATLYLAEQGHSIIAIEKEGTVGGATRHASAFCNLYGGSKEQNAKGIGNPVFPLDPDAFFRKYNEDHNYSMDEALVKNLINQSGEATDWILEQPGVDLVNMGLKWQDRDIVEGGMYNVFGMGKTIDAFENNIATAGGDIRLNNKCEALVFDGNRVLGVMVTDADGEEKYLKGEKGVILCSGGIGMNKDLIKKYLPSAYEGAVQGGPMPYHTGETFRMGLGVGADYSGFDSWCCWEGAIDETIAGGDGQFWHYFYHGERQLFHNPWLIIDKRGQRQPYYAKDIQPEFNAGRAGGNLGDVINTTAWMSCIGHHVYSICDSNFPENIFKLYTTAPGNTDSCRIPIADPTKLKENGGLVSADWLGEVDDAVERGAVKKADTLDELAEMLLLDPDVLKKAVEKWNAVCARGVDDELAVPYHESWLNPVADPPFYAAIVGGQLGKTQCGLRVDEKLQVLTPEDKTIPGLWANFFVVGGISGEGDYGGFWNPSMFGGQSASWFSGYIAAKELLAQEK